jgi:aminobenzoyl-glutamate utilization protein B
MRALCSIRTAVLAVAFSTLGPLNAAAQSPDQRLERLKSEALTAVEGRAKLVQEMVDMVFSFGELGFQEFETSRYLTGILEENGFAVERGVAGMPTAWVATWGSGKPVISLGSDIDGIPQSNQKPGVLGTAIRYLRWLLVTVRGTTPGRP